MVSDCYPKLSVAQIGKTVVHMLGRRKWAETSGVTGISSHIAIIRISFIYYSGLEFDVVNLMSDLLSHWLSVPRLPATSSLILLHLSKPIGSLDHSH